MDGPTSPLCIAVRPGEARRRARGPRPGCPRRSCRPPRRRARGPRAGGSGRGAAVRLVAVPVRVLGPAPVRSSASVSRTGRRTGPRRAPRPHRRAGAGAPPGSRDHHSTREGGRRDRRAAREDVCQGHDLAGRPAISRTRPGRDGTGTGPGPTTTPGPTPGWRGPGPGRPRPGPACVNCRSAQRNPGAGAGADPGPACAMRARRDTVHPASRRASPARRNPPALDPREPTSHNASPGDITRTTPRGRGRARAASPPMASPRDSPGGGDAQAKTRRAVAPTPAPARRRSHRSRRRVASGAARPPSRRRSASAPAAPPDRSPEEP